jgi:predicted nucleic acid-binding protein
VSVLDASAFAEALTSATPLGAAARGRIAATRTWHAPAIFPAEVLSAIRGLVLGGHLETSRAERARRRLRRTRVVLHPFAPFAARVWELRDNLTVYDAWYAALAERLEVSLVTTDARLANATGPACATDLIA